MAFKDYEINEGTLSLPEEWRDQTLNVFVTSTGPGLSLAISRDEIPWGMSFEDYALGEIKKVAENFDDYEEDERSVLEIDGARCPLIHFHWTSPKGKLFQMMTMIECEKNVIILTATMPEQITESQAQKVKEIFLSYRKR